jgi:hypothetical protein
MRSDLKPFCTSPPLDGLKEGQSLKCLPARHRLTIWVSNFYNLNRPRRNASTESLRVLIPDVKCCSVNGFEFAIEIFVTSDISADKRKLINEFGLPVVRIDLSKFYKKHPHQCRVDLTFINENLKGLLTDATLKSWVIPPNQESIEGKLEWTPVEKLPIKATVERPKPDGGSDSGCLLGIVTLGLIYLFYPRKKTGKRYRS